MLRIYIWLSVLSLASALVMRWLSRWNILSVDGADRLRVIGSPPLQLIHPHRPSFCMISARTHSWISLPATIFPTVSSMLKYAMYSVLDDQHSPCTGEAAFPSRMLLDWIVGENHLRTRRVILSLRLFPKVRCILHVIKLTSHSLSQIHFPARWRQRFLWRFQVQHTLDTVWTSWEHSPRSISFLQIISDSNKYMHNFNSLLPVNIQCQRKFMDCKFSRAWRTPAFATLRLRWVPCRDSREAEIR